MEWKPIRGVGHMSQLLDAMIQRMIANESGAVMFAQVQRATGLRSIEVLERGRWVVDGSGEITVQLAKRGDIRVISAADLPVKFLDYIGSARVPYEWTYPAYLLDLAKTGIEFKFNGIRKTTYSHAFRYGRFRELMEELGSVDEVQAHMHHAAQGSTMYYLLQKGLYKDYTHTL